MEEILPPETEAGTGYEPVRVRQFTVFIENKVGRLLQLVRAYEESGGRIVGISVQNQADSALVKLICSTPEQGRHTLLHEGFSFTEQELLVVELPRLSPQPLLAVCAAMAAAEINIQYAYPLLVRPAGPALALCVDDQTLAAQLLMRKGFKILAESDLKE